MDHNECGGCRDDLMMSSTTREIFDDDFEIRKKVRTKPWDHDLNRSQDTNNNTTESSNGFVGPNHRQNETNVVGIGPCLHCNGSGISPQKQKFRILLIRHGLSEANIDPKKYVEMADSHISLSEEGMRQAEECGEQIYQYFKNLYPDQRPPNRRSRLWVSPYLRARQTAQQIYKKAHCYIDDVREHILLGEQQFGVFEGVDWETLTDIYPKEIRFMQKMNAYKARFWARPPLGESRFDVCQRVHQAFGSFHRDADHEIYDLIIVSHGITIRAFLMMWLHLHPEWFEVEPNPGNCSVRVIYDCSDQGYIWGGPEQRHSPCLSTTNPSSSSSSSASSCSPPSSSSSSSSSSCPSTPPLTPPTPERTTSLQLLIS